MTNSSLRYDVLVSDMIPIRDTPPPDGSPPHWSPMAHTLIHGPTEAAIVDPPITIAQTDALANWIASFGKRLSYIYITHWHADHWLGTNQLARRFPGVTVLASPRTIGRMKASTPNGVLGSAWTDRFPGQLPSPPIEILAEPMPRDGVTVDGEPIHGVEVGHSDTKDATTGSTTSTRRGATWTRPRSCWLPRRRARSSSPRWWSAFPNGSTRTPPGCQPSLC